MPRHSRSIELEQFWRRHLSRQDGSGIRIRDYCQQHGLKEPSFYSWRRIIHERDRQAGQKRPATPAFLPIAVVDASTRSDHHSIEIRLGSGCSVCIRNGCDRGLLADVLVLLQNQPAMEAPAC
jgi:hypothetical protein